MSITQLPTPPDRSDPGTFSSRADAFLGALPTFAAEANALADAVNSNAAVAAAAAIGTVAASGTSTTSLTIGTGSKSLTTQTGKAITAGMMMKWAMQSDAAKYMVGTVTSYDAVTGDLVLNVTETAGSGTSAAWEGVVTAGAASNKITRRAISSADTVGTGDIAKLIDITGGTFTLAFDECATLGNGAWGYIRNSGTGDVTLDPNGSETIDGLTSFVMYPGAVRLWQCDGSAIRTVPLVGGTKTFSSTGNYVWAPGVQMWRYDAIAGGGGGGGGARAATRYNGGGGGAGERIVGMLYRSQITVGGSTACTVGAGGTGGNAAASDNTNGGNGTNGGNSTIGSLVTANYGVYGGAATTSAYGSGGRGGSTNSANPSTAALAGQFGEPSNTSSGTQPYATEWAGTNGRAGSDSTSTGKQASLGGQRGGRGGGSFAYGANGNNGANPGDGGDGGGGNLNGSAAGAGGNGVAGQIVIVEVI